MWARRKGDKILRIGKENLIPLISVGSAFYDVFVFCYLVRLFRFLWLSSYIRSFECFLFVLSFPTFPFMIIMCLVYIPF